MISNAHWCFTNLKRKKNQVWKCMPVILALGRLQQEDHQCEASLGYIESPCLPKQKSPTKVVLTFSSR
jgi:hypothetical protein